MHVGATMIQTAMTRWWLAVALVLGANDPQHWHCAAAEDGDAAAPSVASPAFQPGEISIGEPLQIPFRKPDAVVSPPDVSAGSTPSAQPPAPRQFSAPEDGTVAIPSKPMERAAAGNGWLGITVDDSLVPGRLVVVDVAPDGPAALSGVAPQDLLLGIDGTPLRTSDEMAAMLATISPGMTVKVAVGKGERIEERSLVATKRPAQTATPSWQGSGNQGVVGAPSPALPAQQAAVPTVPPPSFVPPAAVAPISSTPGVAELPVPAFAPSPESGTPARGRTALGVRTVPVDAAVQARYRLPEASGAYVIGVVGDLPASKAGVPPGSVIVAIRNQPVRAPQDLTRLVTSGPVGAPVPLQYVLPGGESREAEVVLQSLELPLERALVGDEGIANDQVSGARSAERFVPPALSTRAAVAPVAAETPMKLEEEVRMLRRQVELLHRRLERLEPSLIR